MAVPLRSKPFTARLLRRFLNQGERKVLTRLGSGQLAQSLSTNIASETQKRAEGFLNVPHYWARYYHSGRNQVRPTRASILIWFRNPRNDPRLAGGRYPIRKSQVKKLSRADFQKWSRENRKVVARYKKATGKKVLTSTDYIRMRLPMIVAKASPGVPKEVKHNPFFDNEPGGGMHGFDVLAGRIAEREAFKVVEERLYKSGLKDKKITRVIR